VIVEELLLLVVGGCEEAWLEEAFELEIEPLELELELELAELEVLDGFVDVAVALTDTHGVVGLALAQAHREFAAPKTFPAEAPHALITQFSAADWIAAD
jgi:hypothetical protein